MMYDGMVKRARLSLVVLCAFMFALTIGMLPKTAFAASSATLAAQAKKKAVTVKASKVRKKACRVASNVRASGAQGALSYANASTSKKAKKLVVNARTGKVTVPKGTRKGTYKVKVRVTAAGDATHRAASRVVSYSIKVK